MKFTLYSLFLLPIFALAEPVEDNSFLVEEAYNQEPGVVQFINVFQSAQRSKSWSYVFINEIPIASQSHQFSYEIPYSHVSSLGKKGVGDIKLNYRYEFFRGEKIVTTGRASFITASGKANEGLGKGSSGYETSLISSVKVLDKWVQHWNIGASIVPNAKNAGGDQADNSKYFANASNVYLVSDNFHFMLELNSTISQATLSPGRTEWAASFIVSPSFRYAIDFGDWQFVPGVAAPFSLGLNAGAENQFLAYLSIEGAIW